MWKNLENALRVPATLPLLLDTKLDPIDPEPPPLLLLGPVWVPPEGEEEKTKPAAALEIWASHRPSRVEAGAKESVRWRPPMQRAWMGLGDR